MGGDAVEAPAQRHRLGEAGALHAEARLGGDAGGVLVHAGMKR
jgi:hypothetical protein